MRRRNPSLFERSSETVLHDVKTWEALVERLQDVRLNKRELIQVVILGSDRDLPTYFQSKSAPQGIRHLESTASLSLFHYQRKFGGSGNRESVSGEFLLSRTDTETMYLLVFVGSPRFWRNGI